MKLNWSTLDIFTSRKHKLKGVEYTPRPYKTTA